MSEQKQVTKYMGSVGEDYLKTAAQLGQAIKARAIALMTLHEGATVLDVGCGSGEDLLSLAKGVGSSGRVVGLDFSPELLAQARLLVSKENLAEIVELQEGDALNLPFEDNLFDVVHTERVLMHIKEAEKAISELIRVTKPNGKLVLVETDFGSLSVETPHTETQRRLSLWAIEKMLNNGYGGRKLKGQMKMAGLQDVTVEIHTWYYDNYQVFSELTNEGQRVSEGAIAMGIITREEWSLLEESWKALDKAGGFFATSNLIIACGVKATK